ncbi:cold-shock protein [Agrilutibacter solisilvae]|uniref:Cold shock domain-containing protein n=1 Tax=Agrilutibacter solisilvae TaxID=2763317 RepID=A0A974XZ75_9GAMM|nr:cold shock domain-containing protein [Lysobacter solisilvae]QSX78404.1 cold shock domain-containing protein [Lysobacter solisilvae]
MGEQLGKVAQWHDDKGYGFIAALDAEPGPRAFFHIRDYEQAGRRPETGEIVRFTARRDGDGRLRASGVRRAARPVRTSRPVANRPARAGPRPSCPVHWCWFMPA